MRPPYKLKFLLCGLCRPIIKALPMGQIRVLNFLGGASQQDQDWQYVRRRYRVFFDHDLQAYIAADLAEWGSRWHYFAGRYYDRDHQAIIRTLLRPGDTYVDIGANLGIHSILASRIVGDTGKVHCFEPVHQTRERLQAHLIIIGIKNCEIHDCALGDRKGEHFIEVAPSLPGAANLRAEHHAIANANWCRIEHAGEQMERLEKRGNVLVKIDVEGYEGKVVRGMAAVIQANDYNYYVEVTPAWIHEVGDNPKDIYLCFTRAGYQCLLVQKSGPFAFARRQLLWEVEGFQPSQKDYLFVRSAMRERLIEHGLLAC